MAHKVKEEVVFGNTNHFVSDLNEQAEAIGVFQSQAIGDAQAEIFCFGARLNLKRLKQVHTEKSLYLISQIQCGNFEKVTHKG